MRKITERAIDAFYNDVPLNRNGNTSVTTEGVTTLSLFGHDIAIRSEEGLQITLAGWNTVTTRERLNGLDGVHVTTKKGQAYLNGQRWHGGWVLVSDWK